MRVTAGRGRDVDQTIADLKDLSKRLLDAVERLDVEIAHLQQDEEPEPHD